MHKCPRCNMSTDGSERWGKKQRICPDCEYKAVMHEDHKSWSRHTEYEIGEQPCDRFSPDGRHGGPPSGFSVHECIRCKRHDATVVFCQNCSLDHHSNGYRSCVDARRIDQWKAAAKKWRKKAIAAGTGPTDGEGGKLPAPRKERER